MEIVAEGLDESSLEFSTTQIAADGKRRFPRCKKLFLALSPVCLKFFMIFLGQRSSADVFVQDGL
jgi:hypothetical protein